MKAPCGHPIIHVQDAHPGKIVPVRCPRCIVVAPPDLVPHGGLIVVDELVSITEETFNAIAPLLSTPMNETLDLPEESP